MLRCILLCNTIVIDKEAYKCDSPDEICLVSYVRRLGAELVAKRGKQVVIRLHGREETWVVEKTLGFSSERKRMSVLARREGDERTVLFAKGADDMMLSRSMVRGVVNEMDMEANHCEISACLQEYADKGCVRRESVRSRLRTLVMGMRELTEEQFELFVDAITQAEKVLQDRDEAKAACFERIEKELVPLGVSGIEDLLQDEVMDTIDVRVVGA